MTGISRRPISYLCLALVTLLLGCGRQDEQGYQGYAEGDYLYLAAPRAGFLETLDSDRGSRVKAGSKMFSIAAEPDLYELEDADAQQSALQANLKNLQQPRRQSEIDAQQAELNKARADLAFAETQLRRLQTLARKGFASKEEVDDARAARDRNAAQVEAARDRLELYRITLGREAEIQATEEEIRAAKARGAQKRWQVATKRVLAPAAGEVTEAYYRPGEWVPAGQPVLSFLPDGRRFIRFFVAETELAAIRLGQTVSADCDGCARPVEAKVTFISPRAEYTPPVIYSREERAKLVFRVEATPSASDAAVLHPGLPMIVHVRGERT